MIQLALGVIVSACSFNDSNTSPQPNSTPSGLVIDADASQVTAAVGTPLHHAQICAQYLGPIPAMSCADATLMPITVDGVEVFETPARCDRPSALTGTCETEELLSSVQVFGSPRGKREARESQDRRHDSSERGRNDTLPESTTHLRSANSRHEARRYLSAYM